jgi:hypothetical protein
MDSNEPRLGGSDNQDDDEADLLHCHYKVLSASVGHCLMPIEVH